MTIEGFVMKLAEMELAVHAEMTGTLEAAAVAVEREAKREIGHYQQAAGPFPKWRRLAPRTLRDKRRLGYAPPDRPLERTGDLRAKIEHKLTGLADPAHMEAHIGANGVKAVVQEAGTQDGHVPARSFLGRAAVRMEERIIRALGEAFGIALGVRAGSTRQLR